MKPLTIRQIAKMTGLTAHTLRYYEKIGLLGEVDRNASGYREYSGADVEWIRFLLRLRTTGMPISEMKIFSELRSRGDSTIQARFQVLERHKQRVESHLKELSGHLEKIEEKMERYQDMEKSLDI
jgi:DNA-binding transcriptional MerR regulator